MMQKKSDDAVSPVIGIMLMVVITVVIAGVIAVFGTGMVTDIEPAPNVVLEVEIINFDRMLDGGEHGLNGPDFRITHLSGDSLETGDIEIRFSWSCSDSTCTVATDGKHHSTYSADAINGIQPMVLEINDDGKSYTVGDRTVFGIPFGDAVLKPGYRINTLVKFLGDVTADSGQHIGNPYMDQIFNNNRVITGSSLTDKGIMKCLDKGTKVDVTILHIPTNSIIYDKSVIVK